ncbi:MAG TPA: glycosyltransferase family 4 protein [Myxococcota bacterium]|nr:glycosyltransferase family 4 protein [Myxococcota bacterium]
MRLLVVTTGYPRFEGDLAGTFVARWCEALAARGHALLVVAPADGQAQALSASGSASASGSGSGSASASSGSGSASASASGSASGSGAAHASGGVVTVTRFRYALRPRLCYGAGLPDNVRDARAVVQLPALVAAMSGAAVRAARRFRPDVVASHWVGPATLAGQLAAKACGARHVAVLHSEGPKRAWLAAALADRVVAVSAAAGSACAVVPLGVDVGPLPARDEARAALGVGDGAYVVLALGRLVPVKGFDVLLAAAPRGTVVRLAGDGPARAALELAAGAARARGVDARLVGTVLGARKGALLAAADVLAVPSRVETLFGGGAPPWLARTEGLPIVVREGQAAGLPVVASAVGGIPAAVSHGGDAWLVPPGDAGALRDALVALRDDPARRARLAAGARARAAADGLGWDRVAARWESVLMEAA